MIYVSHYIIIIISFIISYALIIRLCHCHPFPLHYCYCAPDWCTITVTIVIIIILLIHTSSFLPCTSMTPSLLTLSFFFFCLANPSHCHHSISYESVLIIKSEILFTSLSRPSATRATQIKSPRLIIFRFDVIQTHKRHQCNTIVCEYISLKYRSCLIDNKKVAQLIISPTSLR